MKAIILAAGRGSRMKNLTVKNPKCLVNLRGKTLLDWQLEALRGAGVTQISIVTGYKRELLLGRGLKEFNNKRWMLTNMVRSLMCADSWLSKTNCIVSYSDIFYSSDAVKLLIDSNHHLAITYDPNWKNLWTRRFDNPLIDSETFKIDEDHIITEIGNKPFSLDEIQGQYMGLLRFTPTAWLAAKKIILEKTSNEIDKIDFTSLLQDIINYGEIKIKGIPYQGEWGEFDSEKDLNLF